MAELTLYTYFRSSAAYRVRIALNLKALEYHSEYIHLVKNGGENYSSAYKQVNPQCMVPSLKHDQKVITQSLSICEYLEETFPENNLLPTDSSRRAYVRMLCNIVCCDIHPLNNLRVLQYLEKLDINKEERDRWYQHWIVEGFDAMEKQLGQSAGKFCLGDQATLADCFLIPQVYNALRYECDVSRYPVINRIYGNCMQDTAFEKASPEQQADALH